MCVLWVVVRVGWVPSRPAGVSLSGSFPGVVCCRRQCCRVSRACVWRWETCVEHRGITAHVCVAFRGSARLLPTARVPPCILSAPESEFGEGCSVGKEWFERLSERPHHETARRVASVQSFVRKLAVSLMGSRCGPRRCRRERAAQSKRNFLGGHLWVSRSCLREVFRS